eukprot:6103334-Lingulodinium_polyedra.AAC.1
MQVGLHSAAPWVLAQQCCMHCTPEAAKAAFGEALHRHAILPSCQKERRCSSGTEAWHSRE